MTQIYINFALKQFYAFWKFLINVDNGQEGTVING